MELFDYFAKRVNYHDCKSLEEASEVALAAMEASGIRPENVLHRVLSELGHKSVFCLLEEFLQLRDAAFFRVSVRDVMEYEFMAHQYPSDVADILVGIMLLHAQADLRAQFDQLRSWTLGDECMFTSPGAMVERLDEARDIDF